MNCICIDSIVTFVAAAVELPESTAGWFYHYQTLVAGILALGGAFFTIQAIEKQIKKQKEKWEKERESKAIVDKARMLLSLGGLLGYMGECLRYVHARGSIEILPTKPDNTINVFVESLEFLDPVSLKHVKKIIEDYQVDGARLSSYSHTSSEAPAYKERVHQTLSLCWRILSIFDYARDESDLVNEADLSHENLASALRQVIRISNNPEDVQIQNDLMVTLGQFFNGD